jgi:hypothetical protein
MVHSKSFLFHSVAKTSPAFRGLPVRRCSTAILRRCTEWCGASAPGTIRAAAIGSGKPLFHSLHSSLCWSSRKGFSAICRSTRYQALDNFGQFLLKLGNPLLENGVRFHPANGFDVDIESIRYGVEIKRFTLSLLRLKLRVVTYGPIEALDALILNDTFSILTTLLLHPLHTSNPSVSSGCLGHTRTQRRRLVPISSAPLRFPSLRCTSS